MNSTQSTQISFPRWWIERIRDQLVAMGKLPSGHLGDWAFIFRDQLSDALARSATPTDEQFGGGAETLADVTSERDVLLAEYAAASRAIGRLGTEEESLADQITAIVNKRAAIPPHVADKGDAVASEWHRELIDREPDHGQYGIAATPQSSSDNGEAVAWQIMGTDGNWSSITREPYSLKAWRENGYEVRPLYATPQPSSKAGGKPLSSVSISQLDDANNACLELAAKHGYATGHGDTVADMIREFSAQIPPHVADKGDAVACEICGEPLPEGEEMFRYHGFSGKCPAPKTREWRERSFKEQSQIIAEHHAKIATTNPHVADKGDAGKVRDALQSLVNAINRHGNWDDGCFYYGSTSASELQHPLKLAEEALATPQPSSDDAVRASVIEECARKLETSYPNHVRLNAACAAIRSLATQPSSKAGGWMDSKAAAEAASAICDYADNNFSMFEACCDETPIKAKEIYEAAKRLRDLLNPSLSPISGGDGDGGISTEREGGK